MLREVAIQGAVRIGADEMVSIRGRDGEDHLLSGSRPLFVASRGRPRQDVLSDAAVLYVVATLTNRPALKEVASKLEVSQSTATRLVSEGRSHGLLPHG